jgi:hypothetical protein
LRLKARFNEKKKSFYKNYLADTENGLLQKNDGKIQVSLMSKNLISPDTYEFIFRLPNDEQELGKQLTHLE